MLTMNYFDDLEQEAVNAFNELDYLDSASRDLPIIGLDEVSPDTKSLIQGCQLKSSDRKPKRQPRNLGHYVFKLQRPLSTSAQLNATCCLRTQPRITDGEDEDGVAHFCEVSYDEKEALQKWLLAYHPRSNITFAQVNKAFKAFSPHSAYPTLGIDTTLPHYRPSRFDQAYEPRQNQYPVTYFFYGTLADPLRLARLFNCLSTPHALVLEKAVAKDGALRTWARKYYALVDHPGEEVEGWAFSVQSKEEEDALRVYETAKYEVVRARIELKGGDREGQEIWGCTFRFAGWEDELDPL